MDDSSGGGYVDDGGIRTDYHNVLTKYVRLGLGLDPHRLPQCVDQVRVLVSCQINIGLCYMVC